MVVLFNASDTPAPVEECDGQVEFEKPHVGDSPTLIVASVEDQDTLKVDAGQIAGPSIVAVPRPPEAVKVTVSKPAGTMME